MSFPANYPAMSLGGHLKKSKQNLQAWLHSANAGTTSFPATRWWQSCWRWWVLDITHDDQPQRINGGAQFIRKKGIVALYRPKLRFEEWQEEGGSAYESWILFTATGSMERALNVLAGNQGYCHFLDPENVVPHRLGQISGELFSRNTGFQWRAQAAFLELIAIVTSAKPCGLHLRVIKVAHNRPRKPDLQSVVENLIRTCIAEPLNVADLARHAGLGLSTFAHTYRKLSGETPYQTIVRLKMEAAKRLLVHEGFSVKETADRLGYTSEFQFSRCFKRMEGRAPTAHVRAMTEKGRLRPPVVCHSK